MKSNFERWAESFGDNSPKSPDVVERFLYKLEDGSKYGTETGVYKCQESYFVLHELSIFYTTPIYMVWVLGKNISMTDDYREAIGIYQNAISEIASNLSD